jgi:hypothetical protein
MQVVTLMVYIFGAKDIKRIAWSVWSESIIQVQLAVLHSDSDSRAFSHCK